MKGYFFNNVLATSLPSEEDGIAISRPLDVERADIHRWYTAHGTKSARSIHEVFVRKYS